ncbi:cholinesterase 2-like [Argonauta hians]
MEALKYILLLFVGYVYTEGTTVRTTSGKISGSRISVLNTDIDVFLGIPYAKPPVGDLRFRRPEPVEPWNGVKETKTYSNSCMQVKDTAFGNFEGSDMWNANTNLSEDCLYLNIWVPRDARKPHSSLTTMIWIYGGSFNSGTSSLDLYNGQWLAASENVIVASLNYRLGPFGFLYLNDKRAPGNMGLLDQNLAIKWIRDNIASFGGDPNKLTLFGESAGSASVSLHVVSPLSRKLFNNAIMMSGTQMAPWVVVPYQENLERAKEMAVYLKCPTENNEEMLDCFLKADAEKLAIGQFYNLNKILPISFGPVIDDYFLVKNPREILRNKSMKKDVLLGFLKNEGMFFLFYAFAKYFSLGDNAPIDKLTGFSLMRKVNEPKYINIPQLETISYLYGSHVYSKTETDKYRYILDQMFGDVSFKCPTIEFAQEFSTHSNVYVYSFEHRSRVNPWPKWAGIMHGYEIEFVFAQALSGKNYSKVDTSVTQMVTSFFANFSKSSNPSGDCPTCTKGIWPKFKPKSQKYIVINNKPKIGIEENYMNNICGFWSDLFPKLNQCYKPELKSGSQNIVTSPWRVLLLPAVYILFTSILPWDLFF